jgi:serine/threonine-protein kinase
MGFTAEGPYLVMERLAGGTLAARMALQGTVHVADALDITVQLLRGLQTLHASGHLHRDVTPANVVLVLREGGAPLVKLIDFGLACQLGDEGDRNESSGVRTETGLVLGTPQYIAPEQASGERAFLQNIDLYACGVVLYGMLAGRPAFAHPVPSILLDHVRRGVVRPLAYLNPSLDPHLVDVVEKAMSPAPANRYQTAKEMMGDLESCRPAASLDSRQLAARWAVGAA